MPNRNSGGKRNQRTGSRVPGHVGTEASDSAVAGTEVAFDDFVAARLQALLRFGRMLTGNTATAEDLVQTALAKSYPKWNRIESSDPEGYVRRVMANTHASWWRRPWRERPYEQLPERPGTGADPYVTVELRDAIWQALSQLSYRQRTAVVLRFYEELSVTEIAEVLGCRAGTVKSLISRGLTSLRHIAGTAGLQGGDESEDEREDSPGGSA